MLTYQREYLLELIEQLSDDSNATFVSFDTRDIDNPDNLVCQLSSSQYPIVLCAFLECAKYEADQTLIPFNEVTPPSVEEVEDMLEDYNGKMPSCLTVFSISKHEDDDISDCWEGIQYSRYFLADKSFKYMSYALSCSKYERLIHGKGKIPVNSSLQISFEEIEVID